MADIELLEKLLRKGHITRRDFIAQASAMGLAT